MLQPCETSKGRRHQEEMDYHIIDEPFLNDVIKIQESKSLRRLMSKTQVLSSPDNPHIRNRASHTLEVCALSTKIAYCTGLNVYLCMAIALGHDIGHTPNGHLGEEVLSEFGGKKFSHNVNSVVVAQHIERKGKGLNLTHETLEGILYHSRPKGIIFSAKDKGMHQEYSAVMFADKIAYTFSDINDAIRYGYLSKCKLPDCATRLGESQRERNNRVINALVRESQDKGYIDFEDGDVARDFRETVHFMYEEVYQKIDQSLHRTILFRVCEYFQEYLEKHEEYNKISPVLAVSLLTDRELKDFGDILQSCKKPRVEQINHFGIFEILPYIKDKNIDYTDPDLDWKTFY